MVLLLFLAKTPSGQGFTLETDSSSFVALLAEKQEALDSRSTRKDVQRIIEMDGQFLVVHHLHHKSIW